MLLKNKPVFVKSLSARMAKEARHDSNIRWEHNAAFYSAGDDPRRPGRHNMTQEEFETEFSRHAWVADSSGANKVVYLHAPNGTPFKYICVKRDRAEGNQELIEEFGIQCVLEIKGWLSVVGTPDEDLLCPIFKWFWAKSDKARCETMRERVVIICQKATYVSNLADCCRQADEWNWQEGYRPNESAFERRNRLEDLCRRKGWHDIIGRGMGGGNRNCGVIFDYHANCYKAVIIDYAL